MNTGATSAAGMRFPGPRSDPGTEVVTAVPRSSRPRLRSPELTITIHYRGGVCKLVAAHTYRCHCGYGLDWPYFGTMAVTLSTQGVNTNVIRLQNNIWLWVWLQTALVLEQ
ncbi:hypothetical protein EMCRGX_G000796 [Ephydatia muelleri]